MKDVIGCEKFRGVVNKLWSENIWMGKPTACGVFNWIHRLKKLTRRTEISKYPKEKKSIEIPLVVTSEEGKAQWFCFINWNNLERLTIEGDSPVQVDIEQNPWVRRDTWNPVWIWGDHPPRLNTPYRPIVNKYREGKVKRTPKGEWNRTETGCLQAVGGGLTPDGVPFV